MLHNTLLCQNANCSAINLLCQGPVFLPDNTPAINVSFPPRGWFAWGVLGNTKLFGCVFITMGSPIKRFCWVLNHGCVGQYGGTSGTSALSVWIFWRIRTHQAKWRKNITFIMEPINRKCIHISGKGVRLLRNVFWQLCVIFCCKTV